jgi:REP element-mobilizing transposase RayT
MGWPTRMYEPGLIYFATIRCLHGRLLLRPSKRTNDVLGGVLSRAVRRNEVELFAFVFFSNHLPILVRAPKGNLPAFMQYLLTNISKKVGALVDWKGPLWERRYSAEPVLDEEAILARIRYILSHGVKEGFVRTSREWPGLSSLPELLGNKPRTFRWFDWSRRWLARSAKGVPARFDERFAEEETLELTPLPLVRFARKSKWRRFLRRTLAAIRQQGWRAHPQVMGAPGVLAQDPHHRPERPKRSRRPWCHAVSADLRRKYIGRYRAFRVAFSEASVRWRAGDLSVVFPEHAFRPFLRPRPVASLA